LNKWIDSISDRTALDIANRTSKAFLNVADWIRIYGNTQQAQAVVNILLALNIPLTPLIAPTTVAVPAVSDINTLIANIDLLRVAACLPSATGIATLKHDYQAGSSAIAPDYNAVNDWERDLQLIRDCLVTAVDYMVYCGVASAGQPRFWQAHFHTWAWVPAASSPVRHLRCGLSSTGSGLLRQNYFRRY
jgi:hypothetical protein